MIQDPSSLFENSLDNYVNDNINKMNGIYSELQKRFTHVASQSAADGALIEVAAVIGKEDVDNFVKIYEKVKNEFPPKYDVTEASVIRASIFMYTKSVLQAAFDTGTTMVGETLDGIESLDELIGYPK
jgi:hypothetical protein